MHRVFGSSLSSCRHVVQNTWVELVFSGCKTILPTNRFPSLWIVIIPNMLDRKPDPKSNHLIARLKPHLEFRSETHRVMDWWSSPFYGKIMENRPCLDHIVSITLLLGGDLIPLRPLGWSSCAKLLGCLESSGCGCENHRHWGWTQILTSGTTHFWRFFVMTVPPGEVIDQKYPRGYSFLSPHVHGLHSMFWVPFPSVDPQTIPIFVASLSRSPSHWKKIPVPRSPE